MTEEETRQLAPQAVVMAEAGGPPSTGFDGLIQRIIRECDKAKLEELRREFHTRLRLTQTHPDDPQIVEDLWDFFYDWCVFEQRLPDGLTTLSSDEFAEWARLREANTRSLFAAAKVGDTELKLKDLYNGRTYVVPKVVANDFVGIDKGDILEGRLVEDEEPAEKGKKRHRFARRPSYHPASIHDYIKRKVRQFKSRQDFTTFQAWLWILVGMSIKHRMYPQLPIEKIYDDNSRI
jgi:hypothetical protein